MWEGNDQTPDEDVPSGGEFYRLRGANSRDAQRRRKERKAAVYERATCVRKVNPAGFKESPQAPFSLAPKRREAIRAKVARISIILSESAGASEASLVCAFSIHSS